VVIEADQDCGPPLQGPVFPTSPSSSLPFLFFLLLSFFPPEWMVWAWKDDEPGKFLPSTTVGK